MSDGENLAWMLAATCLAIVGVVVVVLAAPPRTAEPACVCADGGAP